MLERLLHTDPSPTMLPVRNFDHKKIVALSNQEFAIFYGELMNEYRDKDGWWKNGRIPECDTCHQVIPRPSQLRRYQGRSLHPECFKKVYEKEKDTFKGVEREYFDKVANVVLDD